MFDQLQEGIRKNNKIEWQYWLDNDIFSLKWWIIVLISVVFLLIFLALIDKQRIKLISIAFLVTFILVAIVNEGGYFFGLWSYPHQFVPFLKNVNAVDFLTIPVILTLLYQFFSRWKYFLIANIIVLLLIAYVAVPLFVYFKFYVLYKWNYTLSFVTLFIVSICVKVMVDWINKRAKQSY
ncbi:CBO0543 family protein [Sutcliffiella rhizosphaerae]|uniref:Uncharacterized protein n=1 Tax=Sutcliffiella rhizosphaerae TaxID=2880967 RepID=A0ABM8YTK3_9BACI|nr:CBO0543 family protein [Sutcliffiella rhizosphaerae]CAG9623255.1 hypothetical protein BACCIP111883_04051 [Sutcliffiella rhizosphaerae]